MKKIIYYFMILFSFVIICAFTYLTIVNNQNKKESTISKNTHEKSISVEEEHGYNLYRPEQTVRVKGAKLDLTINENSDESAVVQDMHEMSHQKVQAEFKEGAIEMTLEHINKVDMIVNTSNFQQKEKLLEILKSWKQKEFNKIVENHNFLWKIQGGKIGEATDRLTTKEEKEFIENNFR